jgi:hypothetical protein
VRARVGKRSKRRASGPSQAKLKDAVSAVRKVRSGLKAVESVPKKNGSDGHVLPVPYFLIANARAVGTAGFLEIADALESLAADVEHRYSDLEQLEGLC